MTALALAADDEQRRDQTINLRVSRRTRELIDTAARVKGQKRSEFILDSARKSAEDVLLDQRLFLLDSESFDNFLKILDEPPPPSDELKALLAKKAPWEK